MIRNLALPAPRSSRPPPSTPDQRRVLEAQGRHRRGRMVREQREPRNPSDLQDRHPRLHALHRHPGATRVPDHHLGAHDRLPRRARRSRPSCRSILVTSDCGISVQPVAPTMRATPFAARRAIAIPNSHPRSSPSAQTSLGVRSMFSALISVRRQPFRQPATRLTQRNNRWKLQRTAVPIRLMTPGTRIAGASLLV